MRSSERINIRTKISEISDQVDEQLSGYIGRVANADDAAYMSVVHAQQSQAILLSLRLINESLETLARELQRIRSN